VRAPAILALGLALGCGGGGAADGPDVDAGVDDDPLIIPTSPAPGSLDDLHARIIKPRCSGQPGLCHNGQFEPNLATPGLTYAYLVRRPGLEKPDRLRVAPEDPGASLLVDKLRFRNNVSTQMPLGAEPLGESEIAEIEAWIAAGALRDPAAAPAPELNNPPRDPDLGVFAANGTRLDDGGAAMVTTPATVTLRHTVQDFETAADAIPFSAVLLFNSDGRQVVLSPANMNDPGLGPTTYDASGPMGPGDLFDYRHTWTIGTQIELYDPATGLRTFEPAAGKTLNLLGVYLDGLPQSGGIAAFAISPRNILLQ
jgi:hypothetical protein